MVASHKPTGISTPPPPRTQLNNPYAMPFQTISPTYSTVHAPPARAVTHIPGVVKSQMSQDGTHILTSHVLVQLFAHFKDSVECQVLAGPSRRNRSPFNFLSC